MFKNLKSILIFAPIIATALALFGSISHVYAEGEKWELIDSTTIRVSGGAFSGPLSTNGTTVDNPRSITLKLKTTPNTDPSIWQAEQSFNLGTVNNGSVLYLEDSPREVGQFCIDVNNFSNLLSGREAASFDIIHREDCNKPYAQMRYINPTNTEYMRCGGWGPIQGQRCNTLWASSQKGALSSGVTISYSLPNSQLKCGDPGYTGDCPKPYDPATADCTKTDGSAGAQRKCEGIQECILDAQKAASDCTKAWDECVISYTTANETPNYNACASAIAKGDFEGGKRFKDTGDSADTKTSCTIDGVGWIVCGMSRFLASVMDGIYGLLTVYLTTPVINTDITSDANTLYKVWSIMRNIANVAFVIVFLIIIYSQLTGAGVTNYGIKKLLPKLIMSAILVNISYWIAAIAVDLSNIAGSGIYNLIHGIAENTGGITIPVNIWETVITALLSGSAVFVAGGVITATVAGLTAGTIGMAALWIAIPAVLSGVLAVIIAFAILAARQALIIILIILSPLAFVALLLPNTEGLFKTWKKSLMTMLVFYPIFSILFAGSQLAALIILSTAGNGTEETVTTHPVGHIIVLALFIQVIPLIITPLLVKFSGGLIGQIAGIVNNKGKGLIDRSRKTRDRKLGLAANEVMQNASKIGGRNPFARTARFMGRAYRRSQNDGRTDADRQKRIEGINQAEYLKTQAAGGLSTDIKNAQHEIQTLEAGHNAEFEVQKDADLTYKLNLANQKVEVEKLYDKARFEESKSTSQAISANNPLAQQIQEARDTQQEIDITNNRLNSAKGVLQQEFATELRSRPGMAMRAGGIDPQGSSRVVASAIEAQRKAYEGNVSAFEIKHADQRHDSSHLSTIARDPTVSIAEREAAGRAVVKSGDIDAITPYQDYLAQELVDARASGDNVRIGNAQALQRAYAATIGSSPGKPMGLGAAEIAKFNTGDYTPPASTATISQSFDPASGTFTTLAAPRPLTTTEVQTLNTIEQKGVSMDKWAAMDKADIKRAIELARSGVISAGKRADMRDSIDKTLTDIRWSGRMQEREKKLLSTLGSLL